MIGFSTLSVGMRAGSADSTAAVMSAGGAAPRMASYQMDLENAIPEAAAEQSLEPQARTGGPQTAQAEAKIIYTARLTLVHRQRNGQFLPFRVAARRRRRVSVPAGIRSMV